MTLFVQLYESNTEAVKSEIGTFFEVFPERRRLGQHQRGQGYDLVLLGQTGTTQIDVAAIQAKLRRPEYAPMAKSLQRDRHELGGRSVRDLRRPQAGPGAVAARCDAQSRQNLRLQYLAGLGLNLYQADVIYSDMLQHMTSCRRICSSRSDATKASLFAAINRAQGR